VNEEAISGRRVAPSILAADYARLSGAPVARAIALAVSVARRSGLEHTASTPVSARRSPAHSACSWPVAVNGMSLRPD
jgi:hypothetical protein